MSAAPKLPELDLTLRSLSADWNYARWEQLPADGTRYEVVDGVLYITTAPSFFHQWIIQQLVRYVGLPALETKRAFFAFAPIGLLMQGCDPVQPDFVLVLQEHAAIIQDRRIRGVPDLVVEVMSPSTAITDSQIKRYAYARAGVPEYVLIDPLNRLLLHYRLAESGRYSPPAVASEQTTVSFDCLPGIQMRVGDLFAGAPDTTV